MRPKITSLLLLFLLQVLVPAVAWADDGEFDTPNQAFTWYSKGPGCMHLKLMTTNASPFRTLHEANYFLRDSEGNLTKVFYIYEQNSSNSGYVTSLYLNQLGSESLLYLTNDTKWKPLCLISYVSAAQHDAVRTDKENGYAELDWYYPVRFAGKRYTLRVEAKLFHEGGSITDYVKDLGTIEFDEVTLETYDAVPGTEEGDQSTLRIPVSCDRPINYIEATYTDRDGNQKKLPRQTMEEDSYFGFVSLPATEKVTDLQITANIRSATIEQSQLPERSWPSKLDGDVTKTIDKLPLIHHPRLLRADVDSVGAVVLRWKVMDRDMEDLLEGDIFQIQRSLTGRPEDFENVESDVVYDPDLEDYTFRDSTLMSALTAAQIDAKLGIPLVRYRVYRATTEGLWGLEKNPTVAYVQPQFATLSLLQPRDVRAVWSDEAERQVRLTWNWEQNDAAHNYVWDERAGLKVETRMFNRQGQLVDSLVTALTAEQLRTRQAELTLTRSCVRYEMRLVVDPGTSPIGRGTGTVFQLISTKGDYEKYAKSLNTGQSDTPPNLILAADISISEDDPDVWIGFRQDKPFTGNFNGNGHTLTVDYPDNREVSELFLSPVRFAGSGAVFCNLTTAGDVTFQNRFAGGLLGMVSTGEVYIENCTSAMNIMMVIIGDGSIGGLVGLVDQNSGTDNTKSVRISNCLVNHSYSRKFNTTNCSGFVAWRRAETFAKISNSYFQPKILFHTDGWQEFLRSTGENPQWGIIEDCSYFDGFGTWLGRIPQGKKSATAPDNWCWKDGKPLVRQVQFSTPVAGSTTAATLPDDGFYYENLGHINRDSLKVQTLQSSVLLTWENVDEMPVDYYEVWRRDVKAPADSVCLITQLVDMQYEDKTTSPTHSYEYRVRGVNSCEGTHYESTLWVPGHCVQTGRVSGYVRFPDGTGIPGVTVIISSPSLTEEVVTDESGYFEKDGLPYWNGGESAYNVLPKVAGYDSGLRSITFGTQPGSNSVGGVEFYVEKSVKFSGFVRYLGTSIPVQGASFLVDGVEVRNAGGKVTTDFEGRFSFRMLPNMPHSIQAVKDGHTFYQNGFYHADDDTTKIRYDFNTDVAGIYFYDDTRVTLIGRVAGGMDQAAIPLGNSLSRNNLGDDLKMVFVLEGDNASQLVFDITDRSKKERDEVFTHTAHDKKYNYQTRVHTTSHRVEVTPDVHTGEYMVKLPPVKWKIQQITARGYATLFQDGQTGDVIDLTDSIAPHTDHVEGAWANANGDSIRQVDVKYHAQYNRIYHSPVLLERKQVGFDKFDYFGEKNYTMRPLVGGKQQIPIAYPVTTKDAKTGVETTVTHYTFGHPVFSTDRGYNIKLAAVEKYYYNNNVKSDTVDVVRLGGGTVTVRNGLVSGTHREVLQLDANGERTYTLRAAQMPYLLTGKDALCTVNFTLERDGVTLEGEPIKGYVFSQYAKPGAKDILTFDQPVLVDILRDPPGAGSTAKLTKGSTLKLSYQMDMSWKGGLTLGIAGGGGLDMYTGTVMLAAEFGLINSTKGVFNTSFDLIFSGGGQRAFAYTLTSNEDISTDGGVTMVGADADLYLGMETNVFLRPTVAIRAINDSTFQASAGARKAGYMVEIASGRDEKDSIFHLVRDEVVGLGQTVKSTFVHSQEYIVQQLIPNLAQQCQSLMFTGTEAEAKAQANATGQPVYRSLRTPDDPNFGVLNTQKTVKSGDAEWEYVYNTTISTAEEGINYQIVLPNGYSGAEEDKVKDFCEAMYTWANMVATNEKQKLEATNKMKNFDVDGGGSVTYSEDFATEYSNTTSYNWIFSDFTHNFFANPDPDKDSYGDDERTAAAFSSMAGIVGPTAAKLLFSLLNGADFMKRGSVDIGRPTNSESPLAEKEFKITGTVWKFSITPTVAFGVTPKNNETTKYNRKETFTIKMDKKSHLDFDVYYSSMMDSRQAATVDSRTDIFVEENFLNNVDYMEYFLDRDVGARDIVHDMVKPRGFIYRTRGGATVRAWEDERKTLFYRAGTVLDERTKKIENPVIRMDKQSVSGVPYDQPARFKLYMTNESEQAEAVGGALQFFTLYLDDTSNPKGARLLVDGMPLSRAGMTIKAVPGEVTEKTLEVWAGEDFDYENLKIGIISQGDVQCFQEVAFSVHYLLQAGAVDIATPGDKWIMNTDAPFDAERGWYLPVVISGFNKNQKNFDHIEFQYKESTRGDDYWTNLCGFYADSTAYRAASGTKAMIPENGNIVTNFFGEGQVMEKAYDLRARLFCRNGNSFITSDSKVLTGVKDTRRPQLFGTVEPKDGILGSGDNIIFNFSENIEHNYLQTDNFEVMGETNETAVQEEPALLFSGKGYAQSEARRNFADKNVTIEVLIKPENTGQDMPIFSHGTDGKQLQLWLTKEKRLRAVVDGKVLETDTTINTDGYRQVALVLDRDKQRMTIIAEECQCSLDSVKYSGYGPVIFGSTNQTDVSKRQFYKGRMLQGRVWNRAMDAASLTLYAKKLLTGYEVGLTDYYPMNQGSGDYATDLAQGAHLKLDGATWALPRGMALRLDRSETGREVKGMKVRAERFSRTEEQDYTLMFWFKTDENGRGALISNGSGKATDTDARHKFFIGFEGKTLKYRTNGREYPLGDDFSNDEWHHYAMTVNRAHQVASIYVDRALKAQFSTDTLGGMKGDNFYLGNMVWYEAGQHDDVRHQNYALTGWLDGICLFEQALPPSLIRRYSEKSVGGSEKGLVTFLGFNRQERQLNNEYTLQPYGLSQKVYYDDGKELERRDTVFVDPLPYVINHIDKNLGAPMQAYQELRNLNFSFVGRDNQLLVNIDERDARINKRQVFVTIYDIPDLNGNYMASPATTEAFVDRSPLRWEQKTYKNTIGSLSYSDMSFDINIYNDSGAPHTFTIENMPKWLTVNTLQDVVDAKSQQTLTFTINKDTNVGTYDDIIYLTDEDGLSEPLMLNITVEGDLPKWYVDPDIKQFSMSIVGRVQIGEDIVTDSRDIVGVFDATGRCMGCSNVNYETASAESFVYLSVYDSMTVERPLNFKFWHYDTGKVMLLTPSKTIKFKPETFEGTTKEPVVLKAGSQYIQTIELMPGWNWVSLNVNSNDYRDSATFLKQFPWQDGDMITDENENLSKLYNNGMWISNRGTDPKAELTINVQKSYRVKVSKYTVVEITGNAITTRGDRTIPVKNGWNSIGFTPMVNLPVSTALADYLDDAEDGDLIKSKTEFAMFTETADGSRQWKGNLKYMKPGEGYMLYRQRKGDATFTYAYFEPSAAFFEETGTQSTQRAPKAMAHARTMSLTAVADGVELQPGDKLIALTDGEVVGEAEVENTGEETSPLIFLSIAGDKQQPLSFAVERDGERIATTGPVLNYLPDAISGSPKQPTKITFLQEKSLGGNWYDLSGRRVAKTEADKRNMRKGIYIHNGKKQVVK